MGRRLTGLIRAVAVLLAVGCVAPVAAGEVDASLERVLAGLRDGSRVGSLEELDRLVARHPTFRLAHLMRGDLLLARTRALEGIGAGKHPQGEALAGLRAEARARVRAMRTPEGRVPRYLLRSDRADGRAVVVDAAASRLYVFDTSGDIPRLEAHFYASVGRQGAGKEREGDRKTPLGVYRVTGWIPGGRLPDLYGAGAFPIDYPNPRDRSLGRTGHGIWIHGVPSDTYARAPLSSDGCVALSNDDLERLAAHLRPGGTPVVIANGVDWVAAESLARERDAFDARLESWRRDWEGRDARRYLAHYSPRFAAEGVDLRAWSEHKRRVNARKRWIRVGLSEIEIHRDPSADDVMVVTFLQDYRSSDLTQRARKRQYWARESGEWRIVYEATAGASGARLPESFPAGDRSRAGGTALASRR